MENFINQFASKRAHEIVEDRKRQSEKKYFEKQEQFAKQEAIKKWRPFAEKLLMLAEKQLIENPDNVGTPVHGDPYAIHFDVKVYLLKLIDSLAPEVVNGYIKEYRFNMRKYEQMHPDTSEFIEDILHRSKTTKQAIYTITQVFVRVVMEHKDEFACVIPVKRNETQHGGYKGYIQYLLGKSVDGHLTVVISTYENQTKMDISWRGVLNSANMQADQYIAEHPFKHEDC